MEIRDSRDKEWFWLDNEYLNGYAKHLGVYCTSVYISLCRHANNKTQTCFPSMKLIAEENGMSTKTVERATKTLEEWNIISITRSKKEDGTQANNIYTLTSKSVWKNKPTDSQSHGYRQTDSPEPTDSHDESRQTVVLHNKTNINNTHITRLKESSYDDIKGVSRNDTPSIKKIEFDSFWKIYPVKKGKEKASQKWEKISIETQEEIITHVSKRKEKDSQWLKGFIPHPTTFLNGKLWEDEYQETVGAEVINLNNL